MLNESELDKLGILDWSGLANRFKKPDLLLGNGFSTSLSPRLDYSSLFDKFLANCNTKNQRIFNAFDTTNFEFILERLSNARDVNQIFRIRAGEIEDAINHLKNGLIKTIQDVHPRWTATDQQQLERIADQLNRFNDIFTLNYDLYLYRIILILNDKHRHGEEVREYSDYFWTGYDTEFVLFDPSTEFKGYRHPYYLHGALFLFKEPFYDYDLKLRGANFPGELLEVISERIKEGRMPLFVTEGTPEQKRQAISRSRYLTFALEKLQDSNKGLVIFGTSLSEPDRHIIDAINQNERDLAVSIHIGTKSKDEVKSTKYQIKSKFPRHKVVFFDSKTLFDF
jgi:hypothetical protein